MPAATNPVTRYAVGIAILLAVWQLLVARGMVPAQYFPPPLDVAVATVDLTRRGELLPAIAITTGRAAAGLIGATVLGIALALVATRFSLLGRALAPVADLFRSLPPAAITPISIFFLGLGWKLYAFILIFTCFWPVFLNAFAALNAVPNQQLASARTYGYDGWSLLLSVQLPAALPDTFIGIRLAAAIALIAAIAAEMLAGRDGLGYLMSSAAFSMRIPDTFVGLAAVMLLGLLLNEAVVAARRIIIGWHDAMMLTNRSA
jgi:ABC-type nitrate/sulfonate/bicarbonate transport system permease component